MSDDFSAQPVADGVGPWHFNRYRVAFQRPDDMTKENLASKFIYNFPYYFNSLGARVVSYQTKTFQGKPTIEFHGLKEIAIRPSTISYLLSSGGTPTTVDIARPHNDWVAQIRIDPNVGFTVQTLKREFFDFTEDAEAGLGGILGGAAAGAGVGAGIGAFFGVIGAAPGAQVGAVIGGIGGSGEAIHVNRMHFLAGRRSWRLDAGSVFDIPGDVYVLETAAVERFSSRVFQLGDKVMQLENMIPKIWIANLSNFMRSGLTTVPQPDYRDSHWHDGGDRALNIKYYTNTTDTYDDLRRLPEFASAHLLYPDIIP